MKQPKIAIFMSAYNHEKYIAEAMDSIVNQTWPHWELFVADDGSSDRTPEIIASYRDERIHFFSLKENTRIAGAVEMIYEKIRQMPFDYMQSMASDDVLDIHKFEKQIAFFEAHPQYAACFTWDRVIFSGDAAYYPEEYSHIRNRSRYSWMNRFYSYGNCISANSALVRKDVFYEMDTMNQRYVGISDFRLWVMISAKYPVYLLQEELIGYRRHENNLSIITHESAMCYYQETARMFYDLIRRMDDDSFYRAYYPNLPMKRHRTAEDALADRFIMLVNGKTPEKEQAAIQLYFDHCSNSAFTTRLKKVYGFNNTSFSALKESGGLPYCENEIAKTMGEGARIGQRPVGSFDAFRILLKAVSEKRIGTETIADFSYAPLWQLGDAAQTGKADSAQFENVKTLLQRIRLLRRESKERRVICYLVASDSDWRPDAKHAPVLPDEKTAVWIARVNREDELAPSGARTEESMHGEQPAEGTVEFIDLFDETNRCLRFADEVIDELTDICYVDCLNRDYECFEMLLGVSLGVSQSAVMSRQEYESMKEYEADYLALLDEVYCY